MTLEQYRDLITVERCFCSAQLDDSLFHYDHNGGWPVVGFAVPQWLYLECRLGHQLAYWKVERASIANELRQLERDIEEVQP
jgi:hypothetical protein